MRWTDEGIVLSCKKYCNNSVLLSVLTSEHGKKKAISTSSSSFNKFEHGNTLHVSWSGKSQSNLGFFKCEVTKHLHYYDLKIERQLFIYSILELINKTLEENETHPELFGILKDFLVKLVEIKENQIVYAVYLKMEIYLLQILGFALDLSKCAITGDKADLSYISPKTGQAISEVIGRKYAKKLLPLPSSMLDEECTKEDFIISLKVTGYFFNKRIFIPLNLREPESRKLMFEYIR